MIMPLDKAHTSWAAVAFILFPNMLNGSTPFRMQVPC